MQIETVKSKRAPELTLSLSLSITYVSAIFAWLSVHLCVYPTSPIHLCLSTHLSIYLSIHLYVYLSLFPVFYLELIELLQRALQILFLYSLLAHTKKKLISLKSSGPSLALGGYLTSFPQDIGGLSMRHFSERTCRRFVNLQFPWTTIKNLKI